MTHLRLSDLRGASKLANEAATAGHPGELPGIVLPGLLELLGADGAAHHWIEPARRHEEAHGYPVDYNERVFDPELMSTYLRLMQQQPLLNHYAKTGTTGPMAISELLSRRQWHRLEIYNEFFHPLEVEDQLAVLLTHGPDFLIGLSVTRDRWGFAARERELLEYLRPFLRLAQEGVEARHAVRLARTALAEIPLEATRAVIVLDRHGRVGLATGGLLKLLAHRAGPIIEGQRLPEPLHYAFSRSAGSVNAGMADLVWARPLRLTMRWHRIAGPASETVLLVDEQSSNGNLGRLTRRELDVLKRVAEGKTNGNIARILGIRESTVRSHLENVFTKLGVSSRTQAAELLWSQQAGGDLSGRL